MSSPLGQLFDRRVVSHAVSYQDALEPLFDEEARLVERAVEKRRREFRAGRHCARTALRALGFPAAPILRDKDRAPLWPAGCVGSITHTGELDAGYAAAVVAPEAVARGLGLDAELDSPLADELSARILTRNEQQWLATQPPERRGLLGKLFFSAKEAFYKCQYPLTRRFLGFEDVELALDLERDSFRVALCCQADEPLRDAAGARGRFFIGDGLILTGVQLSPDRSS